MSFRHADGSWSDRIRLLRRARAGGATVRWPFRLPALGFDRPSERIEIGEGSYIGPGAWFNLNRPAGRLTLGRDVVVGAGLTVSAGDLVSIGDFAILSDRVSILDQLHDVEEALREARAGNGPQRSLLGPMTAPDRVEIGRGALIGIGVVLLPGARVGDGCIVGANSVVRGSIEPYSVVAGVPARVLRTIGAPDE